MTDLRIGYGYDVHRLVSGRALVLGGVTVPFEKGLLGHSDADVLTHAVMDALLGAAALGDIGKLFPDSDARYAGADSTALLRQVTAVLAEAGWTIEAFTRDLHHSDIAEGNVMTEYETKFSAMGNPICKLIASR